MSTHNLINSQSFFHQMEMEDLIDKLKSRTEEGNRVVISQSIQIDQLKQKFQEITSEHISDINKFNDVIVQLKLESEKQETKLQQINYSKSETIAQLEKTVRELKDCSKCTFLKGQIDKMEAHCALLEEQTSELDRDKRHLHEENGKLLNELSKMQKEMSKDKQLVKQLNQERGYLFRNLEDADNIYHKQLDGSKRQISNKRVINGNISVEDRDIQSLQLQGFLLESHIINAEQAT